MSRFQDVTTPAATLLLTSSLLFAGCSSSSDSPALTEDGNIVNDEVVVSDNDTADEQNTQPTMEAVPDPLVQNRTQVDFDITVPAYQSDALQVRLTWGDTTVTADWIGDEFWSTSLELPTNTENTLSVIFSDNNGDIELASFEQAYRTGSNAAEMFDIAAEQFTSEQWDNDNDGTNNLDELIAGSDPLVNEDSVLEVRDETGINLDFIMSNFESRISEERPYNEYSEEELIYHAGGRPPSGASHIIDINIDESGNGALSDSRFEGVGTWPVRTSYTGTRTHSENSIRWQGNRQKSEDFADLYITTSSDNIITMIDERTWRYEETYRYSYDTSDEDRSVTTRKINLTGKVIEGTSLCKPVAGTVESETIKPLDNNTPEIRESITKEIGDQLWRVKFTMTGSEFSETEYLALEFNSTFKCDFVEL